MEITSYLELLKKQRRLMTQQQISAIQEQARLHAIASEKMQIRDRLEERYREVFAKGFEKLSTTSNVLELLPDCDTDADRLKALIDCTQDGTAPIHDITAAMKNIRYFKFVQQPKTALLRGRYLIIFAKVIYCRNLTHSFIRSVREVFSFHTGF